MRPTLSLIRRDTRLATVPVSLAGAATEKPEIKIWDATTGEQRLALHGHNLVILHMGFSPDGQRLLSSSIGASALRRDVTMRPSAVISAGSAVNVSEVFTMFRSWIEDHRS